MEIMAGKRRNKAVWGVDVASSSIKIVRMEMLGECPEILEADIIPFEGLPALNSVPGRDKRIWQALMRFREKYDIGHDPVIVGIPGEHFFMRPFDVFVVGTRTEEELVRYELEQHIPFGLDAVLWDYETFPAKGPSEQEVNGLVLAMKKDVFNNYLMSLSAGEIDPDELQAAPLGLYNYLRYEFDCSEPTLVVDVGAANTTVMVVDGSRYWLRTVRTGTDVLTEVLKKGFGQREVTRDELESIKLNLSQLSDRGAVSDMLSTSMRILVREVCESVRHVEGLSDATFKKVLLLGGGSHTYGLSRMLSEELGRPAITPAGLAKIDVCEEIDARYVSQNLPSLGTAIGLALQGLHIGETQVNVIGSALRQRRSQTMTKRAVVIGMIGAFILASAMMGVQTLRYYQLQAANTMLSGNIRAFQAKETAWRNVKGTPGVAEKRLGRLERMARTRRVWATVVDKVAKMLPSGGSERDRIWLVGLEVNPPALAGGQFQMIIEVGILLRKDFSHRKHLETKVLIPLRRDSKEIFSIAMDNRAGRENQERIHDTDSAELDFIPSTPDGLPRYFLLRVYVNVDAGNIPEPITGS
jgi:type IV pilus assembly protein PilM